MDFSEYDSTHCRMEKCLNIMLMFVRSWRIRRREKQNRWLSHTTIAKRNSWIRPYSSLKFHLKYALWEAPICLCFRYGDIENLIFCSCCMPKSDPPPPPSEDSFFKTFPYLLLSECMLNKWPLIRARVSSERKWSQLSLHTLQTLNWEGNF